MWESTNVSCERRVAKAAAGIVDLGREEFPEVRRASSWRGVGLRRGLPPSEAPSSACQMRLQSRSEGF